MEIIKAFRFDTPLEALAISGYTYHAKHGPSATWFEYLNPGTPTSAYGSSRAYCYQTMSRFTATTYAVEVSFNINVLLTTMANNTFTRKIRSDIGYTRFVSKP